MAKRAAKRKYHKPPIYKLVAFDWNPKEFLANTYIRLMTAEELGLFVTAAMEAMADGKEINLPWIGKTYWERVIGRAHVPSSIRQRVMRAGKCKKCGSTERLQLDHIKPIAQGGTNDIKNLQVL